MVRNFFILLSIVAIPLILFLMFPGGWEERLTAWLRDVPPSRWFAALVMGLLAADIFLPTPSSVLATLSGAKLGIAWGTATTWCGMTLGALMGCCLARWGGRLLVRNEEFTDMTKAKALLTAYGPLALAISRPIPMLAETLVLLAGVYQMKWRRFLPPVASANLAIALGYAVLGKSAAKQQWLPLALLLAAVVPLCIPLLLRILHSFWRD